MSKINEAKQKLQFADYLLSRNDDAMNKSALKNIFDAANLAAREFLGNENVTPALLRLKLDEASKTEQRFSDNFLLLWKMTSENPDKDEITKAYNRVKSFVKFVEDRILDSTLEGL
ncbi:MAG: hypothetical protein J4472_00795 [DPANN group archaeon]|nr:hypothetical protein [DPANN group archaeon]